MRKILSFILIFVAAASTALAQDANKTYNVTDFTKLSVCVPASVEYETGKPTLSIFGTERAINNIIVKCDDGKLVITSDKKWNTNLAKVDIIITSSSLSDVDLNGAVDFETEKGFECKNFSVKINGAGSFDADNIIADSFSSKLNGAGKIDVDSIECQGKLSCTINGAGNAEFSGIANYANLKINGAGSIDAKDLDCKNYNTAVNGVGKIQTQR